LQEFVPTVGVYMYNTVTKIGRHWNVMIDFSLDDTLWLF